MEHEELTKEQIAERLGCAVVTVHKIVKRLGKKPVGYLRHTKGQPTPLYSFNEAEWRVAEDQRKSFAIAKQMPDLGKSEMLHGFISTFGTEEQQALLNASKGELKEIVAQLGVVYCDNVVEARYETLDAKEQTVLSNVDRIETQEESDKNLVCLSVMWDLIAYLVEETYELDGAALDRAFKRFQKNIVCSLDLRRPDDRLVKNAIKRIAVAQNKNIYGNKEVCTELVREDFDMVNPPSKDVLKFQANREFKELAAPVLLAIAHSSQVM
jgi:predicted ArsR family transcriptional regulator